MTGKRTVMVVVIGIAMTLVIALLTTSLGSTVLTMVSIVKSRSMKPLPPEAQMFKDMEYAVYRGESMQLDIYLPPTEGPYPLIIWFHGGAWMIGDRTEIEPGALAQVERGYALASVSYSLTDKAVWPVQAYQVKAAIRWLRAHAEEYNFDPDRFIAWGMSAGGYLACIIGTSEGVESLEDVSLGNGEYSSRVQAVVSWYTPTDLLQMFDDDADSIGARLLGCPVQSCPEKAAAASPITYLTPDAPPFYLMHGTSDALVPHNQSVILYKALQEAGVEATFISLPGYVHMDHRFNTGDRIAGVQEFLDSLFMQ